ncbi:MAG TPA: DEAD/DEAH box helicase [Thermoanaerobaculia bacterium]|nr:DEAD/DEAH box helicase [Thermoanaerobaculia bacterium]
MSPRPRRGSPADPLDLFHPSVASWFREAFPGGPTAAQHGAWPAIAAGENVLLVSPTGTGKTLAAFLVALDAILRRRLAGDGAPRLATLYVSPLKALDNDVHRNLERPRAGIAAHLGADRVPITTAVRTGDTPSRERTSQLKSPPDVLITTPESLYLMLTGSGRRALEGVSTVILDEIHSVAGTKRGSHLALSLERLEELVARGGGTSPQRIALSATVAPVDVVASFAAGTGRTMRPVVVEARKKLDLTVTSPASDFRSLPDGSAWGPAIETVVSEVAARKTTLVFCNNRRLAEKVARKLSDATGTEVPTHHGSVSRPMREKIETALKAGTLPVLVATGSLELGIDVGHVDSVVLLESPKGIARGLQRVGRSGHLVGETARGLFVPLYLDDLFESAATAEAMREGAVEETRPPDFPLDVLAQQLVAESVARDADGLPVTAAELYVLARKAWPYRALPRSLFLETLAMLSGKYPRERFAALAPKLVWDRATDRVAPLPGARLAALLDGGTIGDRGTFRAVLPDRKTAVGELDEEFVHETKEGDVFLLGSRAWRALEIGHSTVVVEEAHGQPAPRMPFWRGEGLGRTGILGERIGRLKRFVAERLDDPGLTGLLSARYDTTLDAAAAIVGSVRREVMDSGGLASDRTVVFETFPNDLGDPCVVVRSLLGRGVNLPWSLVLSAVLREETGVDVETVASDDGILLRTPGAEREVPLERLSRIGPEEARERLIAQLPNSPMFGARFRENAQRALLLPRLRSGRRTPFWLQRIKARDLLQTTRSLPDFPVVAETYRDCLRDLWEMDRLLDLLARMEEGEVERVLERRRAPSPAAASLLFKFVAVYMYEWDAPRAERDLHAVAANRALLGEVLGESFDDGLRPEAAEAARADATRLTARRMARTAEELLLAIMENQDLTPREALERSVGDGLAWVAELEGRGSVLRVRVAGEERLVAAEERSLWEALAGGTLSREERDRLVLGFVGTRGPATAAQVGARYGLGEEAVLDSLERLRLEALVVAGRLGGAAGERRFAGARLAEAIRRKTLSILRGEIRPVPATVRRAFVARRQGAVAGARFAGPDAAERAVGLLRGLALPAAAWEASVLPARLAEPEPDALDVLSARGLLVWRLVGEKELRSARMSLFFRGEGRFVLPDAPFLIETLSTPARALHEALALGGASFLSDLAGPLGQRPETLVPALRELLLAGLVTGDGFHGLRELLRAKRSAAAPPESASSFGRSPTRPALRAAEARVASRLGFGTRTPAASSHVLSGRWSLLSAPSVLGPELGPGERAEAWARLLLARWGVVSRAVVEAAESAFRWSDVAPAFARMELRGDVRRGEFVEGDGPLQYAEPEVVEELRRMREAPDEGDPADGLAALAVSDPALLGLGTPREGYAVLRHGAPVLTCSAQGELDLGETPASDRVLRAGFTELQGLLRRARDPLGRPRRLVVSTVSSAGSSRPAGGSPFAPLFEALGFTRDGTAYAWRAL